MRRWARDRRPRSRAGPPRAARARKGRKGAPGAGKVTPDAELSGKAAKKARKKRAEGGQGPQGRGRAGRDVDRRAARRTRASRLADLDPRSTPASPATRPTARRSWASSSPASATCRSGSSPSPRAADSARCCSSSRAWTPRARAASCATSSEPSTRRACTSPRSRRRAPRRSGTRSCGASARACRSPGMIGVFDRSHYEDVLIVRVHDLVPRTTWSRRYAQINAFEQGVVDVGHGRRQGDAAHLERRAEGPPRRAARARGQALEVQPGRHRRARALGRLHAGLPGGAREVLDAMPRRGSSCPPTASGTPGSP